MAGPTSDMLQTKEEGGGEKKNRATTQKRHAHEEEQANKRGEPTLISKINAIVNIQLTKK